MDAYDEDPNAPDGRQAPDGQHAPDGTDEPDGPAAAESSAQPESGPASAGRPASRRSQQTSTGQPSSGRAADAHPESGPAFAGQPGTGPAPAGPSAGPPGPAGPSGGPAASAGPSGGPAASAGPSGGPAASAGPSGGPAASARPSGGPATPVVPSFVPAFGADGSRAGSRTGVAALSPRYQVGAALALAVVAVTACVHLGMVFLHVAPSNTVTKQHGKAIDDWVYPEFEQNWKLFAPNPLQQNISVQARAEVSGTDGSTRTTGWYDLSAEDGRAIDGNLLPSHTQQNEVRRAWDFFTATHDGDNRPAGLRGALAEQYLRRIVVLRLDRDHAAAPGGVLERVQLRSRITNVPPPRWSEEKVPDTPVYRELPWWTVPTDEAEGGVR
ncbi:DUF5819 family protein [Streptomyces sp. NPDC046197]|uniref:DUF5819 family protein n=1 Tax=Streptomyces sp. NPDC046197 TaxID=3154337 RepID=UPI0033F3C3FD